MSEAPPPPIGRAVDALAVAAAGATSARRGLPLMLGPVLTLWFLVLAGTGLVQIVC